MQQHPFIFSDERNYRIKRHLLFWTFWWLFQGFLYSFVAANNSLSYMNRLPMSMLESLIFLTIHIFLSYSLMYFVIPRFLLKQRYLHTAAWTVILFIITASLSALLGLFIIDPLREWVYGNQAVVKFRPASVSVFLSLMAGLRGGITIGGIAAAIKLMKYWYVKEQRNLQLQKENIESQLQLLKAQVHPHFLFNTLNNIYSFTQTSSPAAAKMVTDLSDLLRFMLYECNQPLVPLAKEIQMIKDYISLEKIRYGNKLELHIDLPDKSNGFYIAPLLLLPLVENCFKHGASQVLDQPWISLKIDLDENKMNLKLLNGKTNSQTQKQYKGLGIINVRKRLELAYPGKHDFLIKEEEDVFIVNLKVELEIKKKTDKNVYSPINLTYA